MLSGVQRTGEPKGIDGEEIEGPGGTAAGPFTYAKMRFLSAGDDASRQNRLQWRRRIDLPVDPPGVTQRANHRAAISRENSLYSQIGPNNVF